MATIHIAPIFIPQKEIKAVAGICLTTAKKLEREGLFPKRRKIVGQDRKVGWLYAELKAWAEALPIQEGAA